MGDVKKTDLPTGLGTLLRHLTELLDGDVEAVYREQGLNCRSRFTPVIRHLERDGPSSIRRISQTSGLTHSAISQTVSEMLKHGLVESRAGTDGRERIISFSPAGEALLPRLNAVWRAIWEASDEISQEAGTSLPEVLGRTIEVVTALPFRERISRRLGAGAGAGAGAEAGLSVAAHSGLEPGHRPDRHRIQ
jgi:DNA-binding MarR family transcriptional regulator